MSLKFTYTEAVVDRLDLTIVGSNLGCGTLELLVGTPTAAAAAGSTTCQRPTIISCRFIREEEHVVISLSQCVYVCMCKGVGPCEVYIQVRDGVEDKAVCEVIRSGAFILDSP